MSEPEKRSSPGKHDDRYSTGRVAILMATYNGAQFIQEQLDSIARQSYSNWLLWVSDDGSTDETQKIVSVWAKDRSQQVMLLAGPRLGFSANFMSLLLKADVDADYFAFCDQDDVWKADKLERAIAYLKTVQNRPAIYFARTQYIDERGYIIGESPDWKAEHSLRFALSYNICAGNTMMMNANFRDLVCSSRIPQTPNFWYDWWLYQLLLAAGGECYFDRTPVMLYRQHGANVSPSVVGLVGKCRHYLRRLKQDELKFWSDVHGQSLMENSPLLTPVNRQFLQAYVDARASNRFLRTSRFIQLEIRRQSFWASLLFWAAVFFNRA